MWGCASGRALGEPRALGMRKRQSAVHAPKFSVPQLRAADVGSPRGPGPRYRKASATRCCRKSGKLRSMHKAGAVDRTAWVSSVSHTHQGSLCASGAAHVREVAAGWRAAKATRAQRSSRRGTQRSGVSDAPIAHDLRQGRGRGANKTGRSVERRVAAAAATGSEHGH